MAKKSDKVKFLKKQKYTSREHHRCSICARSRGYLNRFGVCRICFRELALKGELPGVTKSTW